MIRCLSRLGRETVRQTRGRRLASSIGGGGADDGENMQTTRSEKCVNQVNLLGRLGRDAETRGSVEHPVVVFSIATNSVFTKQDGQTITHVDWHRISVFRPGLREKVAANLRKGDRVFVSGSIRYDEYTDSNETLQRSTTILASDIVNLTKRYLTTDSFGNDDS